MKYIIMHEKNGDVFTDEFETKSEALKTAAIQWNCLSYSDKKHSHAFYIIESVNPDENAENHYDGDYVFIFKHNDFSFDYTVEVDCYNESYSHTETLENGTTKEFFTAFDWFESFENTEVFEKYRCIEIKVSFWICGHDTIFENPVNTDAETIYF